VRTLSRFEKTAFTLTLVAVLLGGGLAAAQGAPTAKPKMPAEFAFPKAEKSPGAVTFSHDKHFDKGVKCPDCHVKAGIKMKKGATPDVTMATMNQGKLCGTCHDGSKAFSTKADADCAKCHAKGT